MLTLTHSFTHARTHASRYTHSVLLFFFYFLQLYKMYSPNRNNQPTSVSSPLRAFTPIVDVIKTAQTNASRDFDRFYDNLWAKLTPKTSNSRTRTVERIQSKEEMASRTSLTPLIERHSLREDARARYEYSSRNPFYGDSESDIGDAPGLLERGVESPTPSYISHSSSIAPASRSSPRNYSRTSSPRRSNLPFSSSLLNQRFEEERKKMDKLQESVTHIRRQSTLLAERSSRMAKFLFEEEEEEDEEEEEKQEEEIKVSGTPSAVLRNKHIYAERTPQKHTVHQLATPPYSVEYNNRNKTPTPRYSTITKSPPMKRNRSPSRYDLSPAAKRLAQQQTSPHVKRTTTTSSPKNGKIVSPKRIIIEDLPGAKLRSAEMITTPGGTMVSNRFWKEIHGLNATHSTPTTPIQKRISTLQQRASASRSPSTSQTWANDDQFWSSSSFPAPSSLNHKLLQVAQQEENLKKQDQERTEDDMHWSSETPVTSSFAHKLFSSQPEDEEEDEEEEEQQEDDRSISPTPSLFKNKLFKMAQQEEKKQQTPAEQRHSTFSEKILQLAQHDAATSTPSHFNEKLLRLAREEEKEQQQQYSLSEELASAKKRDEILKRNNIPVMNPALLAELKAKHHHARIIDDSDSYKFT